MKRIVTTIALAAMLAVPGIASGTETPAPTPTTTPTVTPAPTPTATPAPTPCPWPHTPPEPCIAPVPDPPCPFDPGYCPGDEPIATPRPRATLPPTDTL